MLLPFHSEEVELTCTDHIELKGDTMRTFNIAVIPGDGIGPEVVSEAVRVLNTAASLSQDFALNYEILDWNCTYYLQHGQMMPDNGLTILQNFDAIFSEQSRTLRQQPSC